MNTPRRTAEETWRALEAIEEDDSAEMERILALSPAALDRELAEAGVDPTAVDTLGDECARMAAPTVARPAIAKKRRAPTRTLLLLAAVLALAVLAVLARPGGEIARWLHPAVIGPDRADPNWLTLEQARARARALRGDAHEACARERWQACREDLDEAKRLDPAGDAANVVQQDRQAAADGLAHPPPSPSLPEK